jgi:hypothetical protein
MRSEADCSGCDNAHPALADHRESEDKSRSAIGNIACNAAALRDLSQILRLDLSGHTVFQRLYG